MAFLPLLALLSPPRIQNATEVPFIIDVTTIVVPATVNGRDVRLIFDTGFAGAVVVDDSLDIGKRSGTTTLRDFVGEFDADIVPIKSLKLGDRVVSANGLEAVKQPGASGYGEDTHVDGLMGLSVIKDSVTEISFEHRKFIFHPDSDDISKRTPDNKKTFLVPMSPIGQRAIVMPVTTPEGKVLFMALDTGNAFYATTHKDSLERVGLWPAGQEAKYTSLSGVASGTVTSWQKSMKDLKIFGVPVAKSTFDVIDLPSSDSTSDGTIGFGFLQNFNITFDYKRRLVWLENWTGKVENEPEGSLGISAFYDRGSQKVVVARVAAEGPADKAGIQKGDTLLQVDDEELTNISYRKLQRMLTGKIGDKVKISVSHAGIAKRFSLELVGLVNP